MHACVHWSHIQAQAAVTQTLASFSTPPAHLKVHCIHKALLFQTESQRALGPFQFGKMDSATQYVIITTYYSSTHTHTHTLCHSVIIQLACNLIIAYHT